MSVVRGMSSEWNVMTNQCVVKGCETQTVVVYQGPNQTNQDSIEAWLKHEEPNSTRQQ